ISLSPLSLHDALPILSRRGTDPCASSFLLSPPPAVWYRSPHSNVLSRTAICSRSAGWRAPRSRPTVARRPTCSIWGLATQRNARSEEHTSELQSLAYL